MSKTKRLLISMLTLLCCTGAWAEGELKGLFTINASGDKVQVSQGNLQYFCSTAAPEWRFAEHQYDYVAFDGSAYAENSEKWIDLFGYGTSGYNNGQTCYQPYCTSGSYGDYYTNNLTENADWGYNAISNGGNTENSGWRTLTSAEWGYLFNTRASGSTVNSTSNARYTHTTIRTDVSSGVNGMILFPDGVTIDNSEATSWGTVNGNSRWEYATKCTSTQWTALAAKGCVFLPAAGSRLNASVSNNGMRGDYWSSDAYSATNAICIAFTTNYLSSENSSRTRGFSVRLVKDYTLQQDGEGNYLIGSAYDWKLFATLVQTTPTANAKMTADIDLGDDQTHIGDNVSYAYCGVFDGQGHKLNVNYYSSSSATTVEGGYSIAPFRNIKGATIKNLAVTGNITGYMHCAGVVGYAVSPSTNLINNVTVSANITILNTHGGGFIGHNANATTTIQDCLFNGTINGKSGGSTVGVFFGRNEKATMSLINCLENGSYTNCSTFTPTSCPGYAVSTVTNCYYAVSGSYPGTHATSAQLADGTIATALQNSRAEEVWVQDPLTNQPMLAIFANVVTLTDGDDLTALLTRAGKTCQVNYSRSFTAGKSSTVCLPFAFAKGSVGTFYTFTGISKSGDDYIADMTEYTGANLVANTPYLFTPSATGSVDFSGTYEIPASITAGETVSGDWTYQGTYETIEWTSAPTGIYGFSAQAVAEQGISQGQFVKVGEYVRVKPMRCYLKYKNGTENYAKARGMNHTSDTDEPLPDVIKVRLIGADGHVTAIGTLQTKTGEVMLNSDVWYTLNGIRIKGKPTVKGVYVNNGKKVAIK